MEEHSLPNSTQLNTIISTIKELYAKYEGTPQEDDLCAIFMEKVPIFVEKSLRELESRRNNKTQIEETIQTIYHSCINKYVYNEALNAFYEIHHLPVQLKLIFSDCIWMKLNEHIPSHLLSYKTTILRGIRQKLSEQNVFLWTPPSHSVNRMIIEVKRNFHCEEEAIFLMQIIGAIVLRKEDTINIKEETLVHLWFGPRMEEVVFTIQQMIYNATHYFSSFWNKIKHRNHYSYQLPNICYLCFPSITHKTPFRVIKQSPVLFLTTCCHLYSTRDFLIHQSSIRRTQNTTDTSQLFQQYVSDNLIVSKQEHTLQRFLLLREIMLDFKAYIFENHLPADLLTKQQLLQHIQSCIPYETYGTRSVKKLFQATFTVCSGNTVQEIFDQFCDEMIDTHPSQDKKAYVLTTRQLHNNYRIWCKHYAQSQVSTEYEINIYDDDHHNQHWYCSYNLLMALFQRKYNKKKTFKVYIHPPTDIWKIYLQTFALQDTVSDMQQWAKEEFGIHIEDLKIEYSNVLYPYEEQLITHEIEQLCES
ncbi:MAG TPA: hypothetical protein EYO58_02245 [Flavobacteriales bacterium]|nr:hypothetical protein [Flavobacteriales bacterium]